MLAFNGNSKTRLMHKIALEEIENCYSNHSICFLKPEQTVILEPLKDNGFERKGRFDFLLETKDRELVGFEVLTRPSKGKLKRKLSYAKEAQKFVFVLPENSLELYRRMEKRPFEKFKKDHCFPKEFSSQSLQAWLLDLNEKKVVEKNVFSKVFNVKA